MEEDNEQVTIRKIPTKSAYRRVREHLGNVTRSIQTYEWAEALYYTWELKAAIQECIAPRGLDSKELIRQLVYLEGEIKTRRINEYFRSENCRQQLDKIVNMLPDYGIYLGQCIPEHEGDSDPIEPLEYFNDWMDTLNVYFVEQDIGREEMLSMLRHLRQAVNAYQAQEKEMALLKKHLLTTIHTTIGEMNAVNLEKPGKATFKDFARSMSMMHSALNGFLLSRDDSVYRQLFLREVLGEDIGGCPAEYMAGLEENTEFREEIKQLITEVIEEHKADDKVE